MKTLTIILAVFALGFLCIPSLSAGSGIEKKITQKQLSQALYSLFRNAPLEDIMGDENDCNVNIYFKINDNNEMTDVYIDGKNEQIVRYAYNTLTGKTVKVTPCKDRIAYMVSLRFKVE
jgi:hypothetical protein